MYDYIQGLITKNTSSKVTLENNNIGYSFLVANPFRFKGEMKIYTYQHVREDELTLYGFSTEQERELFLSLISVSGIGPKTALAIIATNDLEGLKRAISEADVKYLQKFPKIGKKTAQQIIVDLSEKIVNFQEQETSNNVMENEDVIEALKALGYKEVEIKKKLNKIDVELSTENKIKAILKLMHSN